MTFVLALTVDGLSRTFGPVHAVSDLSFTAQPGRVTAFLGPNGSGKTTTLRILTGLAEPTAGRALIGDRRYRDLDRPFHTVGVLLDGGFHPGRRARDHLRVLATAVGVGPDRIEAALEFTEIGYAANRRVGGFSTGMKQRLGLAAAMLTDPPVLILDEPLNGLDPEGIHWLRRILRQLADQGKTVLLSSHVLAEVEQIADDVVIISQGRLRAAASMTELAGRIQPKVRVRAPNEAEAAAALRAAGCTFVAGDEPGSLIVDGTGAAIGQLLGERGIILHELSRREERLEAVYFELVGTPDPVAMAPPPGPGSTQPQTPGVAPAGARPVGEWR